jgi:hypothetical protein
MKTFLMIIGAILVIASLAIFWAYSSFKYQPDYFDEVKEADVSEIRSEATSVESRVREELKENGEAKVSGEEISALIINLASKKGRVDLEPILNKVKSEIVDGRLNVEALVNVKELSKQKIPRKAREYLDLFLESAPQDMLENVYVSFKGTPVRDGSVIKFDENSEINIGDFFSYDLSLIKDSNKIKMNASSLRKLGISSFEVMEDHILLKN